MLDALDALHPHLPAIVVVDAQAVALNAASLKSQPEITATLRAAGFDPGTNPGRWIGRGEVSVDIMVAPSQSGRTSTKARSARLEGHENSAARPTAGIEPALVDHASHTLRAGL